MTETTFKAWLAHIELADMDELLRLCKVFAVSASDKVSKRRAKKPPKKTRHWHLRQAIAHRMAAVSVPVVTSFIRDRLSPALNVLCNSPEVQHAVALHANYPVNNEATREALCQAAKGALQTLLPGKPR